MSYPLSIFSNLLDMEPLVGLPTLPRFSMEKISDFDAWEEDDKLVLQFPLAGYEKGSLSVLVKDGILSIEAENKESKDDNKRYIVRSRTAKISRAISLPEGLAENQAKATYENGILTIEIPHSEQKKPKQLEIEYKG